jgi:hypothetical protein
MSLRTLSSLADCPVRALDGPIGTVKEFYFDDATWKVRYLVVDLSRRTPPRKVLIAPAAVSGITWGEDLVRINETAEKIENSPDIDTDKPIVRQHEAELHRHYGWELYWAAEALVGSNEEIESRIPDKFLNKNGKPFDTHLRTTRIVKGYAVHALDGKAGRIIDFILDPENWTIRSLVVKTKHNRSVLVPVAWIDRISFEEKAVHLSTPSDQIEKCEVFDPSTPVGSHR